MKNDEILETYGFNIRDRESFFRNRAGLTGEKLSKLIGKSKNYIAKAESGEFNFSLPVLFDICEVFQMSISEFFADDYQNYRTNMKLFQLIQNIPSAEREKLIDLLSVAFPPKDSKK